MASPAPDQEYIKRWRKLDIPLVGGIAVVTVNTVQMHDSCAAHHSVYVSINSFICIKGISCKRTR